MPAKQPDNDDQQQERGLRFPAYDLDTAIEVARAIHDRGGGSGSLDQIAAWTNHKGKSGSFLTKIASARVFGLITNTVNGVVRTTDRAMRIIAPTYPGVDDRQARDEAFQTVPLFAAIYKSYRDKPLPPADGLENALNREFGLPKPNAVFARRSLIASARQAGYFDARGGQPTHLIRPVISGASAGPVERSAEPRDEAASSRREDRSADLGIHRAVRGAVDMLPEPGTALTQEQRDGLVGAYKTALDIAYPMKE